MRDPVEDTIRELRDSPLYGDNAFVQTEDFPNFVRQVIAQRDDGMPELVQSILNHYFEHQSQEQTRREQEAVITGQMPPQRPAVRELLEEYEEILFQRLADVHAESRFSETDQRPPRISELPEASAPTEADTTKYLDSRLAAFRQEFFDKTAGKGKAIRKNFQFIGSSAFREVLQEILDHTENPSHCRENAFPLFHVLTQLSLMKNGTIDLLPTKEMLAINQRLDKYRDTQEANTGADSEKRPVWYCSARKALESASKHLGLPSDFFIRILNGIADREDWRLVVLRHSRIVDPAELAGQLFEQELRIGGRAGSIDETPTSREAALNAAAARALKVVVPEYVRDRGETIFRLIKSMGFSVERKSVQRNIQRAPDGDSDHEKFRRERLTHRGDLF